jgi:hypothetical protein
MMTSDIVVKQATLVSRMTFVRRSVGDSCGDWLVGVAGGLREASYSNAGAETVQPFLRLIPSPPQKSITAPAK